VLLIFEADQVQDGPEARLIAQSIPYYPFHGMIIQKQKENF
jgi:adenine/guanine phosphoribosyltransferase-like PRPP-binding protein